MPLGDQPAASSARVSEAELLRIETTAGKLLEHYNATMRLETAATIEASFATMNERLAAEVRRLRTMIACYVAGEDGTLEKLRDEASKAHEETVAVAEQLPAAEKHPVVSGTPFTDRVSGKIGLRVFGHTTETELLARLTSQDAALQLIGGRLVAVQRVFVNGKESVAVAQRIRELLKQ
jgi:hypothetical protein